MTTEATRGQLDVLVDRLLEQGDDGGLTVTATLDLSPDSTGRPPVLRALRQAGREAAEGLDKDAGEAIEDEMREIEEGAADAADRGVLGLVWVAHPVWSGDADDADPDPGPFTVLELGAPIRTSIHAGDTPHIFELARAAYLDRPVCHVVTDLHTMDVTRVRYGVATGSEEVDWPAHYLTRNKQRTGRDALGSGGEGPGGTGHSYVNVERYVDEQRNLFANEAAEHLQRFLQDDDLLIIEGVDEARSQLLARLPDSMAARAIQDGAAPVREEGRDLYERLHRIAMHHQRAEGDRRAEDWFSGAEADAIGGLEAIETACEQGRVASVILHEDAVDHFGTAEDTRFQESRVDGDAVERLLQAALRQGAIARFTLDERVLDEGGIVAVGRY